MSDQEQALAYVYQMCENCYRLVHVHNLSTWIHADVIGDMEIQFSYRLCPMCFWKQMQRKYPDLKERTNNV